MTHHPFLIIFRISSLYTINTISLVSLWYGALDFPINFLYLGGCLTPHPEIFWKVNGVVKDPGRSTPNSLAIHVIHEVVNNVFNFICHVSHICHPSLPTPFLSTSTKNVRMLINSSLISSIASRAPHNKDASFERIGMIFSIKSSTTAWSIFNFTVQTPF